MSIAYLNGTFQALEDVKISPLDRGFLFADGIYEVVPVYRGSAFHLDGHISRLKAGLSALNLQAEADWHGLFQQMIDQNGGGELSIYLQVTRGTAEVRDHRYPEDTPATIFMMAKARPEHTEAMLTQGLTVVTQPDVRWQHCNIKTIALLPNVMARQVATKQGADETILVRDGWITEGSSSNMFLVKEGVIHTPLKDNRILPGISRDVVISLARAHHLDIQERNIAFAELWNADEVWLSSSTKEVLSVTSVDGRPVADGQPGPLWREVYELFQAQKREHCPPD